MPGRINLLLVRTGEVLSYVVGIFLVGFFAVELAQGEIQRRSDVADFSHLPQATIPISDVSAPDTTLWAPGRVIDYQASLQENMPAVLGVLAIPSVGLEVPVYPSDSELLMDRGSGVIDGMSYPHEAGNIGIAGHRDGYFRALKDVKPGDKMLLETLDGPKYFVIDATQIVDIDDTALLQDTRQQTVTLVTCYPFYFVGNAPKRFIVTASLDLTGVNQQ